MGYGYARTINVGTDRGSIDELVHFVYALMSGEKQSIF